MLFPYPDFGRVLCTMVLHRPALCAVCGTVGMWMLDIQKVFLVCSNAPCML